MDTIKVPSRDDSHMDLEITRIGVMVLFAVFALLTIFRGTSVVLMIFHSGLSGFLIYGLWNTRSWARPLSMMYLVMIDLALFGYASPWAADDMLKAGRNPFAVFFLIVFPIMIIILLASYVLSNHKDNFG